ncbi:hypothetical protein J9317_10605 [Metabacillus sp. KIGAM252]|uniref:Uncharacterized protein n=1 Tax=Metabacillus flavus TaxID=2823519 RepID=A0ABS5LFC0_9BACI|nr:DUF6241 domain-containing protein [Metabacillus flavus]MBS2969213.1 hypothetical protein [Metabacillus flavus]
MPEKRTVKRAAKGRLSFIAISAASLGLAGALYFYLFGEPVQNPEQHAKAAVSGKGNPAFQYFSASREWDDEAFQQVLHYMSHQKVGAPEKWGAIKITDERIAKLTDSLDKHYSDLEHADIYKDILSRWESGDFSHAVKDHNSIWSLQGGTIGKANRLLSSEEEEKYIEDENLE